MTRLSAHRSSPPLSLPLRLAVVLLALVQLIAPTWHVCSMGGYGSAMPANCGMVMPQKASAPTKPQNPAASQPLICVCESKAKPASHPDGPKLSSHQLPDEPVTCLARLLQSMPFAVAAVPALIAPSTRIEADFQVHAEASPMLATVQFFRGRAPPVAA